MVRMVNSPKFEQCKPIQAKFSLWTRCFVGSLVKTLFSQEIFVTSVPTVQMPFQENLLPSTSQYLLIKDTFTARYNLLNR